MFLSDKYHAYFHHVQVNCLFRGIQVKISTIKIDAKVKIKTAFIVKNISDNDYGAISTADKNAYSRYYLVK